MSFGDFMGLAAVMASMIAISAILAGAYKRRLAFLERKLEIAAGQSARIAAEQAARHATHNAGIENRLRALETIITDGAWDTARQIESLRTADGEPRAN
ncbi:MULTISPECIES: hypothetical protein [Novosphingobium]|uniref:hypothetical protein n=1 Tax=unclassified Novosphingobium TaxID=2644732 RepID=UPI0010473131|nr:MULTISPECIES: hypothetical protein [unclassified Novosphingobium]MPS69472.1 hypothetical protein [Novosphingobium sp.]TCM39271.1 hypothetical protein EDF59_106152 [Novosphingobium sp. ST904]